MSRGKADWKVHLSVGWADPFYLQKTWHRVKSRSSKSFLVFRLHISNFNKILHLTECDVCRLTPHWSSSRPALVTDNGDSGQQNIQTPPSIFRSCFSTQLCLQGQHPTVVLMLHTTTEFIWRLRCLYRAINMKMIATQEWNMEHKLAIMLIVESVSWAALPLAAVAADPLNMLLMPPSLYRLRITSTGPEYFLGPPAADWTWKMGRSKRENIIERCCDLPTGYLMFLDSVRK